MDYKPSLRPQIVYEHMKVIIDELSNLTDAITTMTPQAKLALASNTSNAFSYIPSTIYRLLQKDNVLQDLPNVDIDSISEAHEDKLSRIANAIEFFYYIAPLLDEDQPPSATLLSPPTDIFVPPLPPTPPLKGKQRHEPEHTITALSPETTPSQDHTTESKAKKPSVKFLIDSSSLTQTPSPKGESAIKSRIIEVIPGSTDTLPLPGEVERPIDPWRPKYIIGFHKSMYLLSFLPEQQRTLKGELFTLAVVNQLIPQMNQFEEHLRPKLQLYNPVQNNQAKVLSTGFWKAYKDKDFRDQEVIPFMGKVNLFSNVFRSFLDSPPVLSNTPLFVPTYNPRVWLSDDDIYHIFRRIHKVHHYLNLENKKATNINFS